MMMLCTTFDGARLLSHQCCTAARGSRCLRYRENFPSSCSWSPR